ncbi:MAG: acyltransferase family protein [Novosphingobium sp.]
MKKAGTREVSSLDVMRLLAAQAVMFYHLVFLSWAESPGSHGIRAVVGHPVAFPGAVGWASLGWVGVQIFFVISGFVILMSAENKSASDFLIGRITRIAPGLWFFTGLSALIVFACGVLPAGELSVRVLRSVVLFPVGPWVDGAVWTLVTEALFYAAVFVLIRTDAIRRVTPVIAAATAFNIVFWARFWPERPGCWARRGTNSPGRPLPTSCGSRWFRRTAISPSGHRCIRYSCAVMWPPMRPCSG